MTFESSNDKTDRFLPQSAQPSASQNNIIQTTSEHLEDHIHEDVIEDYLLDTIVDELSIEAIASNAFSPMAEAGLARESEAFHNVEGPSNSVFDEVTGFGSGSSGFDSIAKGGLQIRAEIQSARGMTMDCSNVKELLTAGDMTSLVLVPSFSGRGASAVQASTDLTDLIVDHRIEECKKKQAAAAEKAAIAAEKAAKKAAAESNICDDDGWFSGFLDWLCGDNSDGRPGVDDNGGNATLDSVTMNDAFNELKSLVNPSSTPSPFGYESNDMPDIVTDFDPDSLIDPSSNLGEDGYTKGWDNFKAPDFTPDMIEDPSINWGSHFSAPLTSAFNATITGPKGALEYEDSQPLKELSFVSIGDYI